MKEIKLTKIERKELDYELAGRSGPLVVALRIELSATALSGPSGQPVLGYR